VSPEDIPAGWVKAAEDAYSMNGAGLIRNILAAVVPLIQAAERERLANRAGMISEVKNELDDAFQFTSKDGSRWSHVARDWVESLLAVHAASAGAAEREACARLAERIGATYFGWMPGADRSVTTTATVVVGPGFAMPPALPFADLLREGE
jgi:hypothetical protein